MKATITTEPPFHVAAALFPLLEGQEFADLVEDIRANGQSVPVEFLGDQIIDGRNRWRACQQLGFDVRRKDLSPSDVPDPVRYVLSLNLTRRHLTDSQRAMIGAKALEIFKQQAKARQKQHGQTAPGKKKTLPANVPGVSGDARDAAGAAVKVSGKSIDAAARVLASGKPSVVQAVEAGQLSVHAAARSLAKRSAKASRAATKSKNKKPATKPPAIDPYKQLVMWWQRADQETRTRFQEFIAGPAGGRP
ncbi:MAG: ParB N-terminal domain-containing protein [Planctomycetes bacterium]|nr:ParB N-terminal domain-containing protein [Planctomycetota bacterium]